MNVQRSDSNLAWLDTRTTKLSQLDRHLQVASQDLVHAHTSTTIRVNVSEGSEKVIGPGFANHEGDQVGLVHCQGTPRESLTYAIIRIDFRMKFLFLVSQLEEAILVRNC